MSRVTAIVAAGDGKAAKAVYGHSKAYLELGGRTLVARVVATLQCVPEVDEVWVVGNAKRLEEALAPLAGELAKPVTIVPQYRNLLENTWLSYRRLLPGAGPAGRDPATPEERALPILYLSADLPFVTAQEISAFVQRSLAAGCDYALGLVPEASLAPFYPTPTTPGIRMAYFHTAEGNFRQSNLHLVRPAQLGNREAIEDMYEHRYQKQLGAMLGLAWRILTNQGGGVRIAFFFGVMHLALLADRVGLARLAAALRRALPFSRIESAVSSLLAARFRLIVTEVGGAALDIDSERDLDVAREMLEPWLAQQSACAAARYGVASLAARAASSGVSVLPPGPNALGEKA